MVGVGLAGGRLDHGAEQREADVGVLEALVARAARRRRRRRCGRSVAASGNGRTSCQWSPSRPSRTSPPPWASSSRSVTPASRRCRQRRQPLPDRVVEAQHAALGEAHDGRGRERLGVRGDAEAVVGRQGRAGVDVGEPVGRLQDDVAVVQHGRLDAGDADRGAAGTPARCRSRHTHRARPTVGGPSADPSSRDGRPVHRGKATDHSPQHR